jgi:hypothetical protein
MTTLSDGEVKVQEVSSEEGWALLEKATQRELGIGAKDFLSAWEAGKFDDDPDRPEIMRVLMLLPLIRSK